MRLSSYSAGGIGAAALSLAEKPRPGTFVDVVTAWRQSEARRHEVMKRFPGVSATTTVMQARVAVLEKAGPPCAARAVRAALVLPLRFVGLSKFSSAFIGHVSPAQPWAGAFGELLAESARSAHAFLEIPIAVLGPSTSAVMVMSGCLRSTSGASPRCCLIASHIAPPISRSRLQVPFSSECEPRLCSLKQKFSPSRTCSALIRTADSRICSNLLSTSANTAVTCPMFSEQLCMAILAMSGGSPAASRTNTDGNPVRRTSDPGTDFLSIDLSRRRVRTPGPVTMSLA